MKSYKSVVRGLLLGTLLTGQLWAQDSSHGGRNGGDEMELRLRRMAMQIGAFISGPVGREEFPQLNSYYFSEASLSTIEFDVVTTPVIDRHGVERTCVNTAIPRKIECNLQRFLGINNEGVSYALIFHEILGVEGIEIGHQDNISSYPISSRLLNYSVLVSQMDINRPMEELGFGRSYGVEFKNRSTEESISLVCAFEMDVHRCDTFIIVKKFNGLTVPFELQNRYISRSEIEAVGIASLIRRGDEDRFHYDLLHDNEITGRRCRNRHSDQNNDGYIDDQITCDAVRPLGGIAMTQRMLSHTRIATLQAHGDLAPHRGAMIPSIFITGPIDLVAETAVQVANFVSLPFRGIAHAIRSAKENNRMERLSKLLNTEHSLYLMGTKETIKNRKYNALEGDLRKVLESLNTRETVPASN